jgi:hypothetical protein
MGKRKVVHTLPVDEPGTRYTQERLFWGIEQDTIKDLKEAWDEGEVLSVELLPDETLCAVTLLAAYARMQDIDIVDDYDALINTVRAKLTGEGLHHPDLFMVSMICILHARADRPSLGGLTQINIPEHFENLFRAILGSEE